MRMQMYVDTNTKSGQQLFITRVVSRKYLLKVINMPQIISPSGMLSNFIQVYSVGKSYAVDM